MHNWTVYYLQLEGGRHEKNIELHIENIKYQFCSFVHDVDNDNGRVDFCNTKSIVYRNENYSNCHSRRHDDIYI